MATASSNSPHASIQVQNSPTGCNSRQPRVTIHPDFGPVVPSLTLEGDDDLANIDGDQPESIENVGGVTKKPAWNNPNSGGATIEVGAVMGADSWPALSESARASSKQSLIDLLKAVSIDEPQGEAVGSRTEVTTSMVIPTPNPSFNHVDFTRQTSIKLGGGSSSSQSNKMANGILSQAPSVQNVVIEGISPKQGKPGVSVGESSRDNAHKDAGQRGGSNGGNEQHHPNTTFRRSYSGPLHQGDNSHHHTHGGRRDQERRNQDWGNHHRSFGSRESNLPQQRVGSRPFIRGPPPRAPFFPPLPPPGVVRPFVPPMVYPDMTSHMIYGRPPHSDSFISPPMVPFPRPFYPMPDPDLPSKIINQINYYFSTENLVKDIFLRQKMDSEGWVPINLIAGFNKVRNLTNNIQLITNVLQASDVVEVKDDKLRCKNDWHKWIIPTIPRSS